MMIYCGIILRLYIVCTITLICIHIYQQLIAFVTCLLSGQDERYVKENREIIKRHNNKQKQYCWFQDLLFTISRILEPEEGGKCSMCIYSSCLWYKRLYRYCSLIRIKCFINLKFFMKVGYKILYSFARDQSRLFSSSSKYGFS